MWVIGCAIRSRITPEFFFDKVTAHFPKENLCHINHDDGDEEDLDDQEVLDAVNLVITLYSQDISTDSHDIPNRVTPTTTSVSSVTTEL